MLFFSHLIFKFEMVLHMETLIYVVVSPRFVAVKKNWSLVFEDVPLAKNHLF